MGISSGQEGGDDAMEEEDGGATPVPEEYRGLTVEDVFGRSEEEDMLGDPEVKHAKGNRRRK